MTVLLNETSDFIIQNNLLSVLQRDWNKLIFNPISTGLTHTVFNKSVRILRRKQCVSCSAALVLGPFQHCWALLKRSEDKTLGEGTVKDKRVQNRGCTRAFVHATPALQETLQHFCNPCGHYLPSVNEVLKNTGLWYNLKITRMGGWFLLERKFCEMVLWVCKLRLQGIFQSSAPWQSPSPAHCESTGT